MCGSPLVEGNLKQIHLKILLKATATRKLAEYRVHSGLRHHWPERSTLHITGGHLACINEVAWAGSHQLHELRCVAEVGTYRNRSTPLAQALHSPRSSLKLKGDRTGPRNTRQCPRPHSQREQTGCVDPRIHGQQGSSWYIVTARVSIPPNTLRLL